MRLISPVSRRALAADTPHSLADGAGERWPVIDDIPYLHAGSAARARAAVALLDAGRIEDATILLLSENDAWWDEPPPAISALRALLAERDTLTLREAMCRLGWGRVGDYFAHRWSDPTFVAALALTDAFWRAPQTGFELACGIGHHLLAWQRQGVRVAGGDVVWAKLWIARHFLLAPDASLVCFDAGSDWPFSERHDLVACHDAFYFLRDKPGIAARLCETCAASGVLLVAHVHNRDAANHSGGDGVTVKDLRDLFPCAMLFDDAALTGAGIAGAAPCPADDAALAEADAFSLALCKEITKPLPARGRLSLPPAGTQLTRNPLVTPSGICWPSTRYRDEYAPLASYGRHGSVPPDTRMAPGLEDAVLRRDLLALPERW